MAILFHRHLTYLICTPLPTVSHTHAHVHHSLRWQYRYPSATLANRDHSSLTFLLLGIFKQFYISALLLPKCQRASFPIVPLESFDVFCWLTGVTGRRKEMSLTPTTLYSLFPNCSPFTHMWCSEQPNACLQGLGFLLRVQGVWHILHLFSSFTDSVKKSDTTGSTASDTLTHWQGNNLNIICSGIHFWLVIYYVTDRLGARPVFDSVVLF